MVLIYSILKTAVEAADMDFIKTQTKHWGMNCGLGLEQISNDLQGGPKLPPAILYYVFMQSQF